MTKRHGLIVRWLLGIAGILLCCCDFPPDNFYFPKYDKVLIENIALSRSQMSDLESLLHELSAFQCEVYEQPDHIISGAFTGSANFDYYSIFAGKKFIYKGFYLEAWTERMSGRTSTCYKIDKKTIDYINSICKCSGIR